MRKITFLKSLLVAVCLLAGGNAWASPIETIGTTSSGWWSDFSATYTLEGYGQYHFQFTTTNDDGNSWDTWTLIATDGNDSHGGGGNEYFALRGDCYAWGQATNSNDASDKLECWSTYYAENPSGAGITMAMNGAAVDMVITRESNNIYATATVTPTNGENEFTIYFGYLFGNATSDNIGLFFTVENAQIVLNTAEQIASWSTVWNTDFSTAPSGMTYSISAGSCNITNGYLWYKNDAGSGDRTQIASFTDSKFNVDTDWIMEFDWNCGQSNSNGSNVTFATNDGTAFILSWNNNGNGQVTVTDAYSTLLSTTLPVAGYNIGGISTWSHIVVKGDKAANGIYLTITNGTTTYVKNKFVSTYGYPVSFNGTLGKSVAAMGMDNIVFRTPTVAGFVADPTYTITGAYYYDRLFTLECLTPNTTLYYAASDLEKGDAGWNVYTGEVYTDEPTIYAYAEDDKGNTSEKISFATGVGSMVALAPATVTHSGNGQYTIANSQSTVLGTPTATVHYFIDGGAEQTSTSTSVVVDITSDGTLTYWIDADGYESDAPADVTVYAPIDYTITNTIDFKTSNNNDWAQKGDEVTVLGDSHTYYNYKDQSGNIVGEGLLATTFDGNGGTSWRIQRYSAGTMPYAANEYVALKNLTPGQIVQFECSSAPTIVYNLTEVPASTYTGTYTYKVSSSGDVIVSIGKSVVLKTIKLCALPVSVTITSAGWATLFTPFPLDFSGFSSLKAYTAKVVGRSVQLTQVQNIPANSGVVLQGNATTYIIPAIASSTTDKGDLKGSTQYAVSWNAGSGYDHTFYILAKNGDKVQFCPCTSGYISAGKAYLSIPNSSSVKEMNVVFDDEATGIESAELTSEEGAIFDLQGRKVTKATRGLYIVNGKKVFIK